MVWSEMPTKDIQKRNALAKAGRLRRKQEDPEKFAKLARARGRRYREKDPERALEKNRKWARLHPEKLETKYQNDWAKNLTNFGIDQSTYDDLFLKQSGVCAICRNPETRMRKNGKTFRLAVDHCHLSDKVRGLLCDKCNRGIGYFNDSIDRLLSAVSYLRPTTPGAF